MSNRKEELVNLTRDVLSDRDFNLYQLEWGKEGPDWTLRIYLYPGEGSPNGVTTDKCAEFSRLLSSRLDRSGLIDRSYNLEVSSPGLERKLKEPWHYRSALGKRILVKTYRPIADTRSHIGVLEEYVEDSDGSSLVLEQEGESKSIKLEDVAAAKTKPDYEL